MVLVQSSRDHDLYAPTPKHPLYDQSYQAAQQVMDILAVYGLLNDSEANH